VVASYVAIGIALPTLLEELAKRGPGVSKQNAGEFGRSLQQAPLLVTMLWGTLFAAVAEETLFRGALWSLFDRLVRRFATRARGSDPSFDFIEEPFVVRAARYLCNGWVATLASAAVFGAMHLGMPGAVGIVRVVSTSCLGLALGLARQWGGALAVPILLHLVYNTISLGTTRGWFVGSSLRTYYGVPTLVSLAAGVALVALVGVALVRRLARRPAVAPAAGAEP
jgi:membrane protease YdiL (CAAX protease family)